MERIGDRAAVAQRKGGSELAVDLREQQRTRGRTFGAVERREADQGQFVVGIFGADGDL